MVTRNISILFIARHAHVKGILSSIDFYKRIFSHVISVRTIVPREYPILELVQSSLIQWMFSVGGVIQWIFSVGGES